MSKIYVVYWSSTGNTESMAMAVGEGITEAGAEAEVIPVSDADASILKDEPLFALGAPAMGSEELDPEMDDFVAQVEGFAAGKKIALFGSYGWGDGEWMHTWCERMKNAGATIVGEEGLTALLTPDDDAIAACKALGAQLVRQ